MPAQASTLLDIYFQDRPTLAGKVATPTWHDIASKVVGPSGPAPGADGVPYEVFHHGTRFVTCLLGQAVHAAALHSAALEAVLGPSCDLLVWILKTVDWLVHLFVLLVRTRKLGRGAFTGALSVKIFHGSPMHAVGLRDTRLLKIDDAPMRLLTAADMCCFAECSTCLNILSDHSVV